MTRQSKCHKETEDHRPERKCAGKNKLARNRGDKRIKALKVMRTHTCLLTCRAVILHLADKYAESMFGAPTDAETQTPIRTLIYGHCVDVFTVIPSCKHTERHVTLGK